MTSFKLDINIRDIEIASDIFDLLYKHFESLPIELQQSLRQLDTLGYYGIEELNKDLIRLRLKHYDLKISHDRPIVKANKELKKVYYPDGTSEVLEHFYIKNKHITLIEW